MSFEFDLENLEEKNEVEVNGSEVKQRKQRKQSPPSVSVKSVEAISLNYLSFSPVQITAESRFGKSFCINSSLCKR